jgi:hypothetical protein
MHCFLIGLRRQIDPLAKMMDRRARVRQTPGRDHGRPGVEDYNERWMVSTR